MLNPVFTPFINHSPISIMARGRWNRLFSSCREKSSTRFYLENESNCLMATVLKKAIIFCVVEFTCNINNRSAWFIIREHSKYPFEIIGKEKYIGRIETGSVYEQPVQVHDEAGETYTFRRIRVKLKNEARNGETEIFIITNLSRNAAVRCKSRACQCSWHRFHREECVGLFI